LAAIFVSATIVMSAVRTVIFAMASSRVLAETELT
jgi:hypothetical protein